MVPLSGCFAFSLALLDTTRDLGCSSFKFGQDAPLIAAVNYIKSKIVGGEYDV